MKHLKLQKLAEKIKKYLPIILIIALAVGLRLFKLRHNVSFDADQEELAFKAKEILSGDPVLLGQKTSLGGFSIGPGFIYLWALSLLIFNGDPISGAYLSVFLGVLLIILVYFIFKKIFSEKTALVVSLIMSASSCLVFWDQLPWAPSLFYLSELMIFYGLYISSKSKFGLPLVALGIALGFQSHFAVFLLLLSAVVYLLIYRPVLNKRNIIISLVILFVSILPVAIYDIAHGFINFQRLVSIFTLGVSGVAPPAVKIIATLISNCISLVWLHFPMVFKYIFFALILLFIFYRMSKDRNKRPFFTLSLSMLIIPFVVFMFYKSSFSEYYLMTAAIPFIFILGYLFSLVKNQLVILLLLGAFISVNIKDVIQNYRPINLYAKQEIVHKIIEKAGKDGYGVSFGVDPSFKFGYSYLFDYYEISPDIPPLTDQKIIFTIVTPLGYEGIEPMISIDGIGLRWEGI